jgi:hypothetical protein
MQFHIFTAIITCVVFIYLRYNKEEYNGDYSMYAVILPILLYSYTYFNKNTIKSIESIESIKSVGSGSVVEPTLMTETYPMSSSN